MSYRGKSWVLDQSVGKVDLRNGEQAEAVIDNMEFRRSGGVDRK